MEGAPGVGRESTLFERMLLIRRTEERLIRLRERERQIRGHYHVGIGQEATAVGVCAALGPQDLLFTTHRNHGHILARGGRPEPLVAEVLGRVTGYNGGRGGTLHPVVPELGVLHTSSVVGGCIPVAAGAAYAARRRGSGQLVVAFFGDGAVEEGAFYEAANLGSLWALPLLLVCENNSIPPEQRQAGQYPSSTLAARHVRDVPAALRIPTEAVDGADVGEVRRIAARLADRARNGGGPSFLEAATRRWPGNYALYPVDFGVDTDLAWVWGPAAPPAELAEWVATSDPVVREARRLLDAGSVRRDDLLQIDRRIRAEVEAAADAALAAPFPDAESAMTGVFAPEA